LHSLVEVHALIVRSKKMNILRQVTLICIASAVCLGEDAPEPRAKDRAFLDSVMIGTYGFRDDDLQSALHYAINRSRESDSKEADPRRKGIAVMIRISADKDCEGSVGNFNDLPDDLKKVRLNYHPQKSITLTTLLTVVAKQVNLDLYITSVGIVYCRPGLVPFPTARGTMGKIYETLLKHERKPLNRKKAN
jgi:hypothetical protein